MQQSSGMLSALYDRWRGPAKRLPGAAEAAAAEALGTEEEEDGAEAGAAAAARDGDGAHLAPQARLARALPGPLSLHRDLLWASCEQGRVRASGRARQPRRPPGTAGTLLGFRVPGRHPPCTPCCGQTAEGGVERHSSLECCPSHQQLPSLLVTPSVTGRLWRPASTMQGRGVGRRHCRRRGPKWQLQRLAHVVKPHN